MKKATRSLNGWLWIVFGPFRNMAFASRAGDKVDDFGRGWPEDKPRTRTASAIGVWAVRWSGSNKRHKEPH
jgi:hypothetical protein